MNIYTVIPTLPKPDVAALLTASGYGIRESISLAKAMAELGFEGVDSELLENIETDQQLTVVALACASQISILNQNDDHN